MDRAEKKAFCQVTFELHPEEESKSQAEGSVPGKVNSHAKALSWESDIFPDKHGGQGVWSKKESKMRIQG